MEMDCVSNRLFRKRPSSGLRAEISNVRSAVAASTLPETEISFAVLMLPARIAPSSSVTDTTSLEITESDSVPPACTRMVSPYPKFWFERVCPFAMMYSAMMEIPLLVEY